MMDSEESDRNESPKESRDAEEVPCSDGKGGVALGIAGLVLTAGPGFGLIGTVWGMIHAFQELGAGTGDPEKLASAISVALTTTLVGMAVAVPGVILTLFALYAKRNRRKWFFWGGLTLTLALCLLLFPVGLILGLPLLVPFLSKRREFFPPPGPKGGEG